ncbi:hypothetical protein AB833_04145 [Chromatiales bacterium (ex Bugula neritina AB1)]|nr:hypothetical protein AB833_04145 [Chromatiales bacterium (ex Bugula neritina AB1)]
MKKRYSWPEGHWNWPVELTHQHGVRAGDYIFTGGQADLDANGRVRHPGNLQAQVDSVFGYLKNILHDLDAEVDDLVRLVVYFVGDDTVEKNILLQLGDAIGANAKPVVNTIPLPQLCYPDMLIELEGVAMKASRGNRLVRCNYTLDCLAPIPVQFSHVVRCGSAIFTGDITAIDTVGSVLEPEDVNAQTTLMMDQLCKALDVVGADCGDVLKLNVFYVGDGTAANWEQPALIRQSYFNDPGPAATGISLPDLAVAGLMTKIAVTAMRIYENSDSRRLPKIYSWPGGHWDWTIALPYKHGNQCGNLIHLGGQVSLDINANVLSPGDMVAQTRTAMDNIKKVLAELGATLDDVVKVTAFYQGEASAEALHQNLLVRSNAYKKPGPATSGIPVPTLVYENMLIEIEVTAVVT